MRQKMFAVLVVFLCGVILFCCAMVCTTLLERKKEQEAFDALAERVDRGEKPTSSASPAPQIGEPAETQEPDRVPRNLAPLYAENGDFYGWLSIPGTDIDYPVMHTPQEPQKYLRRDFSGEYSVSGVPFLDGRCTADSDNLVIFGHNMEIGTMFAELIQYAEGDSFTAHPLIELETAEECRVYRVFAVAKIHKTDDWYGFINAASDVEYETRVERLAAKALFCGDIPEAGTQLLTLSTCYGGDSSRLVVVASRSD